MSSWSHLDTTADDVPIRDDLAAVLRDWVRLFGPVIQPGTSARCEELLRRSQAVLARGGRIDLMPPARDEVLN